MNPAVPSSRRSYARKRRQRHRRGVGAGLVALVLLIAAVGTIVSSREETAPRVSAPDLGGATLAIGAGGESVAAARPVYRHSVVPGGVYTAEELGRAMQDEVVAAHYGILDPGAIRAEVVAADRLAYVSYRKNDQVYWTRNKVLLTRGETILTDGVHEVRARCGNRISDTPGFPVAEIEPDQMEFDRLVDETPFGDPGVPMLVARAVPPLEMLALGTLPGDPGGPSFGTAGPGTWIPGGGGGVGPRSGFGPPSGFGSPGGAASPSGFGPPAGSGPPPGVGPPGGSGPPPGFGPPGGSGPPPGVDPPGGSGPPPGFGPPGGSGPPPGFDPPGGSGPPPGVDPPPGYTPPGGSGPPQGLVPLSELDPSDPENPGGSGYPAQVPEPATVLLVGLGTASVLLRRFRRRR
jgi:hypothetical protein